MSRPLVGVDTIDSQPIFDHPPTPHSVPTTVEEVSGGLDLPLT